MIHPSSIDLEAFACGDDIAAIDAHIAECEACRHFVDKAKHLAKTAEADADDVVARALASIEVKQVAPEIEKPEPELAANDHDVKAPAAPRKRSFWFVASTVVTPLAMAAAILLLMRSDPFPRPQPVVRPLTTAPSTVAPVETSPVPTAEDPGTTFKGSVQIAVVRERAGAQSRFMGDVEVRSGDRLRVEVALDREQAILGAVIADDGAYLEIMPAGVRGRGTHYSERSARIDAHPIAGTIVIGTPEAVARARTTMKFDGVITMRVQPEGSWP